MICLSRDPQNFVFFLILIIDTEKLALIQVSYTISRFGIWKLDAKLLMRTVQVETRP